MLSHRLRTSKLLPLHTFHQLFKCSSYIKRHIGPQKDKNDYNKMLDTIGYKSMEDLLNDTIPSHIRLNPTELSTMEQTIGNGLEENEALSELKSKMSSNIVHKSYIGMGYYNTHTPTPILRNIIENPSWYTPYTPYQAEIAQGRLEMLLNFQTMVSDIVGKEISNASLLDESTACAEAMTMCLNMSRKKFKGKDIPILLVSENMHSQNISVVQQRAEPVGIHIQIISDSQFETELNRENNNIFGAILQYPDTYGNIIPNLQSIVSTAHANNIHMICSTDLMSNVLHKPCGEYGIDIVVGNTQRFGVPLGFGGPHAAFLACDHKHIRKMPGRLIGVTKDSRNKYALRMALQTREQFIRRDKATSNICTAQALLANVAAAYAIYHGPNGIRDIAQSIHKKTVNLANVLERNGYRVANDIYFDTITIECKANEICDRAENNGINFRRINDKYLSISIDETTDLSDINAVLSVFGINDTINTFEEMSDIIPANMQRESAYLTHEIFNSYHSETAFMRYLYNLERKDLGLNTAMIPLGSCTMKLNSASVMIPLTWPEVNGIHPFAPEQQTQGYLSLIADMEQWLATVTGFDAVSLQPNSGAAGEYTGLLLIREYHKHNSGAGQERNICLIPTSAHGTNPASAAMVGYKIVAIKCDSDGYIDMTDLKIKAEQHKQSLACCMITYPSTHGVFEDNITELCDIIHNNGGLVYMDGANLQAQLTKTSPGKIGADVCHLNLHKTFCIPHGGGGPGLGPIAMNEKLRPFLPRHPIVDNCKMSAHSISAIAAAPYSSASILVIPWMYIRMMGFNGLELATNTAILNANYMAKRLEKYYKILYRRNNLCAHEFIIDCSKFFKKENKEYIYKIGAEDVAKRLMDYSFHAPTMSWPVVNTLMVEPTESEPMSELDRFCEAMIEIRKEIECVENGSVSIEESPLRHSPHTIDMVCSDEWNRHYTRQTACVNMEKLYWPSVGRVDNEYGDMKQICACPTVEEMAAIYEEEEREKEKMCNSFDKY